MKNDLRIFLKLLKYTDGALGSLILSIVTFIFIIFSFVNVKGRLFIPLVSGIVAVLFIVPSVIMEQLFYAKMAGASLKKEKALFCCDISVFLTAVILFLISYVTTDMKIEHHMNRVMILAYIMGLEQVYNSFIFKLPLWGVYGIYSLSGIPVGIIGFFFYDNIKNRGLSERIVLLLGLLIIFTGFWASRFIRKFFYKKEIAPWVMGGKLYRQMQ